MYRICLISAIFATLCPLLACQTTSNREIGDQGRMISRMLIAGKIDDAHAAFQEIEGSEHRLDVVYPILFRAGSSAYGAGNYVSAARHFRFLCDHFRESGAVAEGLLLSLFMAYISDEMEAGLVAEDMRWTIAEFRRRNHVANQWADLIEAQFFLNTGESNKASQAFQRFRSIWNGRPAELQPYVEDLQRHLHVVETS